MALGRSGPILGVKAIASRLNSDGIRFRGKPFHISNVHRILTAQTYAGTHQFNRRDSRTGNAKPPDEWVASTVPAIVTPEEHQQVQSSLAARSPKRTPPRIVSSPTLLTGIARCGSCGSGMTIRTGKSGRYRYYACAGCAQKGKTVCAGRSISMAALDGMVLENLAARLFTPERLTQVLQAYLERSVDADRDRRRKLATARQRATEIQGEITRLLTVVSKGLMDQDDPQLRDLLSGLKARRSAAAEEIALLEASTWFGSRAITPDRIERFAGLLRRALASDDPAFRKAYLRLFVDTVAVNDTEIRVNGRTTSLAKAASLDELPAAADMVPSFVREWRPRRDSNPRPQD